MAARETLTISEPAQLKALGHPLRLRVLELLGDTGEELTNRELAVRLGVDPGHLHFHVRMLLAAGLIELADRESRREKPYRAVASHLAVAPELLASGAANDARAVMLEDVRRGFAVHAREGRFRSANMTARVTEHDVREIFELLVTEAENREKPENEPLLVTIFSHPRPKADEG